MLAITTDRLEEIQTELSSGYMALLGAKRVRNAYRFLAHHFLECDDLQNEGYDIFITMYLKDTCSIHSRMLTGCMSVVLNFGSYSHSVTL